MRYLPPTMAAALAVILTACSDTGPIQPPQPSPATSAALDKKPEAGVRRIEMLDACDPESFNAVLGAGACTRSGGLRLSQFTALLTKHGSVESWRFSPKVVQARVGQTVLAINRGGETHTFTEVEEFGGGIVPMLNQLSHNPVVAPECEALTPADFVPPGGTDSDDVEEAGTELYQCCIHPWMRTTIHARAK
jgi:plastocyanin